MTPGIQRATSSLGQWLKLLLSFFFLINLFFIYLLLAALGLRCCAQAFSSCGEQGLLLVAAHRLLIAVPSLVEHGLQARRLQQLWCVGSVAVVAHGLSCSTACGIFPDQGSNPCPLHWQADSYPLCHQGSPSPFFLNEDMANLGRAGAKQGFRVEVRWLCNQSTPLLDTDLNKIVFE